ncbi:F-box domain containing protein [Tanacetum coccineum]
MSPGNYLLSKPDVAADGFNPFGNLSQAYSMWSVILTSYNLPPWLCMKESSFMLTLLIPGPKSSGKDIDVYLRPLIDDLKVLWALKGVETIDVATGQKFNMRAMVLWTINDFPARSSLSGWSGQGYNACPTCNKDTPYVRVLEALEGGPIRPRWMYPFERYMKKLKGYVRIKASGVLESRQVRSQFKRSLFQRHVDNDKDPEVSTTSELFALACGPSWTPISVSSCVVDGVRMSTDVATDAYSKVTVASCDDRSAITRCRRQAHSWAGRGPLGMLNTRDKTRNLSLKDTAGTKGPVLITFEVGDKQTLNPLGPHAANCKYIWGLSCGGVPLYYPFLGEVPKERKQAVYVRHWGSRTLFDLRPHIESDRWTEISEGINQHLQKAYNTNKASFKSRHWKADPATGTYDVEAIRQARPDDITAAEWEKYIAFWNDPRNLARAAQNRLNRSKSVVTCRQGSRTLARLRDEMMQASGTQEYPSLIDTYWRTHTVNGVFINDEDRRIYEEMRRLEATGQHTDDEINALARGGKLRGHIPGVGRVLPSRATSRPSMPASHKSCQDVHSKVDFIIGLFRSDSRYSDMFTQFESGGASGSGGGGASGSGRGRASWSGGGRASWSGGGGDDEEGGADEDEDDDESMLTESRAGPTCRWGFSLGKVSLTSVPQRRFPNDMSLGKGGERSRIFAGEDNECKSRQLCDIQFHNVTPFTSIGATWAMSSIRDGPADCTGAPVGCFVKVFNAPSGSILAGVWGSQVAGTIAEETGGMLAVCVGIEDDDGLDIDWKVENKSPPNIDVENEDDRPGLARPPPAGKLRPPTPCDGRGPEVAASLTDLLEVQNTVQKVEPLN